MSSDRDRWQELDEQATPGPWVITPEVDGTRAGRKTVVRVPNGRRIVTVDQTRMHHEPAEPNVRFIAAARIGWPAAERKCAQLRSERDQACALLRAVHSRSDEFLGRWDQSTPNERMHLWEQLAAALHDVDQSGLLGQTSNEE